MKIFIIASVNANLELHNQFGVEDLYVDDKVRLFTRQQVIDEIYTCFVKKILSNITEQIKINIQSKMRNILYNRQYTRTSSILQSLLASKYNFIKINPSTYNHMDLANKIRVVVSYMNKNYYAHIKDLPGFVITGDTVDDIKTDISQSLKKYINICKEVGWKLPNNYYDTNAEFEFEYTTAAILNNYSDIFSKSALAKVTGINERQIWYYACGVHKPRKKQIERINAGLKKLAFELLSINISQE